MRLPHVSPVDAGWRRDPCEDRRPRQSERNAASSGRKCRETNAAERPPQTWGVLLVQVWKLGNELQQVLQVRRQPAVGAGRYVAKVRSTFAELSGRRLVENDATLHLCL